MLSDPTFIKSAKVKDYWAFLTSRDYVKDRTDTIKTVKSSDISDKWIYSNGLVEPLRIFGSFEDMDFRSLDKNTNLSDVANIIGQNTPITLIDVQTQAEISGRTLGDYAKYLEGRTDNHRVLNCISLEFSTSPLDNYVTSPGFVRQVDWIDRLWPQSRKLNGDFPKVQKYLLTGMGGSYTDFHIDFGGTSVWYNVISGKKRFYFIRPTNANLAIYEQWSTSPTQSSTFLPDLCPPNDSFYVDVVPGEVLIIPSVWIHSVYTPVDSMVVGGNFLASPCIIKQIQCHGVEIHTRVAKRYRFPYFHDLNWYFLCELLPYVLCGMFDTLNSTHPMLDLVCSPMIAVQVPYLVKLCEIWLKTQSISLNIKSAVEHTLKECLQQITQHSNEWKNSGNIVLYDEISTSLHSELNEEVILQVWWAVIQSTQYFHLCETRYGSCLPEVKDYLIDCCDVSSIWKPSEYVAYVGSIKSKFHSEKSLVDSVLQCVNKGSVVASSVGNGNNIDDIHIEKPKLKLKFTLKKESGDPQLTNATGAPDDINISGPLTVSTPMTDKLGITTNISSISTSISPVTALPMKPKSNVVINIAQLRQKQEELIANSKYGTVQVDKNNSRTRGVKLSANFLSNAVGDVDDESTELADPLNDLMKRKFSSTKVLDGDQDCLFAPRKFEEVSDHESEGDYHSDSEEEYEQKRKKTRVSTTKPTASRSSKSNQVSRPYHIPEVSVTAYDHDNESFSISDALPNGSGRAVATRVGSTGAVSGAKVAKKPNQTVRQMLSAKMKMNW